MARGRRPPGPAGGAAAWLRRLAGVAVAALVLSSLLGFVDPTDVWRSAPAPTATLDAEGGRRDLFVLPDDGADVVLDEFRRARASIDVAVYLLTADAVVEALGEAEARGVRVRVILEPDPFGGSGDPDATADHLRALGIEVRFFGPDVRFGHIKTFVVDDRVALVTSLNLTRAGLTGNRELGILTTEPADVRAAAGVFRADWEGDGDEPSPGPLVLSPVNSRETTEGLIDGAVGTLDVYAEVITDDAVIALLRERAREGVAVRVIVPDELAPEDVAVYEALASAGVEVRTLSTPYQHAKMVLADGEAALIGSINLTSTSMDLNRELGVVLRDPASVARLAAVFQVDWDVAEPAV